MAGSKRAAAEARLREQNKALKERSQSLREELQLKNRFIKAAISKFKTAAHRFAGEVAIDAIKSKKKNR